MRLFGYFPRLCFATASTAAAVPILATQRKKSGERERGELGENKKPGKEGEECGSGGGELRIVHLRATRSRIGHYNYSDD